MTCIYDVPCHVIMLEAGASPVVLLSLRVAGGGPRAARGPAWRQSCVVPTARAAQLARARLGWSTEHAGVKHGWAGALF